MRNSENETKRDIERGLEQDETGRIYRVCAFSTTCALMKKVQDAPDSPIIQADDILYKNNIITPSGFIKLLNRLIKSLTNNLGDGGE